MTFTINTPTDSIDLTDNASYIAVADTLDLSTPGRIAFQLLVRGTSGAQRAANAARVERALNQAPLAESIGAAVTLQANVAVSGADAWFDLTGGTITPVQRLFVGGRHRLYDVALTCHPSPRGAPYTLAVSGTLSGSTAAFLVTGTPGTVDALVHAEITDTSAAGVISRLRWAICPRDQSLLLATDYTAWVDAALISPATSTGDATAIGAAYVTRTITSITHVDVARFAMPTGAIHRGRRDGWARVWTTGTALSAPTGLSGTVDAATARSETATATEQPLPGQVWQNRVTSGNTVTPNGAATTAGSCLFLFLLKQATTGTTPPAAPAGWKLIDSVEITSEGTNELYLSAYWMRNAASQTTVTGDFGVAATSGDPHVGLMVEILNADSLMAYGSNSNANAGATTDITGPNLTATSFAWDTILTVFAIAGNMTVDQTDFWFSGYNAVTSDDNLIVGYQNIPDAGTAPPQPKVRVIAAPLTWASFNVNIKADAAISTTTTYEEPTPGELDAATYTARVQAIDAAGYRSNATSSATATPTADRGAVDWEWTGSANAVAYVLTVGDGARFYEAITASVTYTLTDLALLAEVAALPLTTGAIAPPPFLQARIGTANDYVLSDCTEVATDGAGAWRLVKVYADRALPPIGAMLNGDWLDSVVEVRARSANGASAVVRIDALWNVPSREPQATFWAHGLALATKRRHVVESLRSGRGATGWIENTAGGAEVGRLLTSGAILLPPGDSIIELTMEQAAGESLVAASVTVLLTCYPRFYWEAFSG